MKKEIGKFFSLSTLLTVVMLLGAAFEGRMSMIAVLAGLVVCFGFAVIVCRPLMATAPASCKKHSTRRAARPVRTMRAVSPSSLRVVSGGYRQAA